MSEQDTATESQHDAQQPAAVGDAQQARDETPEQTIEALRAALKAANREAKDNRLARAELTKLKAEQMTDLERLTAERNTLEAEREAARQDAARYRIAARDGHSDDDAELFLHGDEDQMSAQSARLRQLREAAASTPARPKPDRSQGGKATPPPDASQQAMLEAFFPRS